MLLIQIEKHLRALRHQQLSQIAVKEEKPEVKEPAGTPSIPEVLPSAPVGGTVVPLAVVQDRAVPYAPRTLHGYDVFYAGALKEIAMDQAKKVAPPIPLTLYTRVTEYLAAHKGQEGYPQTIKEFVTLSIEHLLNALVKEDQMKKQSA